MGVAVSRLVFVGLVTDSVVGLSFVPSGVGEVFLFESSVSLVPGEMLSSSVGVAETSGTSSEAEISCIGKGVGVKLLNPWQPVADVTNVRINKTKSSVRRRIEDLSIFDELKLLAKLMFKTIKNEISHGQENHRSD
jgi:hypothetical protein